jgi:hypothetical protein
MTLLGLRAFAKHCHELTSLTITFDATTVPPLDDSPEATVSQSHLNSLDVGTSPISDPFTVAQFMSGLFLNMENWGAQSKPSPDAFFAFSPEHFFPCQSFVI